MALKILFRGIGISQPSFVGTAYPKAGKFRCPVSIFMSMDVGQRLRPYRLVPASTVQSGYIFQMICSGRLYLVGSEGPAQRASQSIPPCLRSHKLPYQFCSFSTIPSSSSHCSSIDQVQREANISSCLGRSGPISRCNIVSCHFCRSIHRGARLSRVENTSTKVACVEPYSQSVSFEPSTKIFLGYILQLNLDIVLS